ncbi:MULTISPECIES: hydantoinase/oxoprolinase family protein [unclassified Crossiella]|uniref:hydantoinase/oxoprolinase family protein n=1 Tax=unclassified Crossiella TaxID=2620835 RepID=UPI002000283B|nr:MULTISPECIES: hydantoinase/oxoprolinase family protein [unclassified Crossiella]MCK2238250.1 hydantoinase/oxoprolinase family protein [Crossiella sp. S99.2]MCK2256290.1 hydantoinase/oxoprolinase family protein [Crossiella sp. S99.1]
MGRLRVSMDIGGTFTDVVAYDEQTGGYRVGKRPTTPGELATGVLDALNTVVDPLSGIGFLVHGTTQGLNALLQRRGVRVLLLASAGAADVYHIARGPRSRMYDLHYRKPEPLVPRRDIVPVPGRIDPEGAELTPLDEQAVRAAAARVRAEGFGAVAVSFLFGYANPAHELRAGEILREELGADFAISLSHQSANEWREYERTSSAVVEAYIGPVVRDYLGGLTRDLAAQEVAAPLHVMQSSGGIISAHSARERPLQTLLSGPVGGTMGGVALAAALGRDNLIYVDMGGTSFDVSLVINGRPDITPEIRLDGLPMLLSAVDIHTVGAGGGSVAWTEAGGLRVGPRSAGAAPGPACYGNGGSEPTVTDANLVLGRIEPGSFAGGELTLRPELAEAAITKLGAEFDLGTPEMAEGVCAVANATMAGAIRTITVSRGIEPREFTLVAFGGAGPMHAVFLARELGIGEVVVPRFPGAFSAWGMLQTEIRRDLVEPHFRLDADLDGAAMSARLSAMAGTGLAWLAQEQVPEAARRSTHSADIRYAAQEYTLTVPLLSATEPTGPDFLTAIAQRFAQVHQARYGHANPGAPIEFVALRTTVQGDLGRAAPEQLAAATEPLGPQRQRPVFFDGAWHDTPILHRADLAAGHTLAGPAIVLEDTATTVVPPGFTLSVDSLGSLVVRREDQP